MTISVFLRTRLRAGFTLLEVMVAIALMAIVITAVLNLYLQTISMSQADRFYTLAPLLAQQVSAHVEMAASHGDMSNDSGEFGADYPGYRWNKSIESVMAEELGTVSENLKKIDITVTHPDDDYTYRLRMYRYIQE